MEHLLCSFDLHLGAVGILVLAASLLLLDWTGKRLRNAGSCDMVGIPICTISSVLLVGRSCLSSGAPFLLCSSRK